MQTPIRAIIDTGALAHNLRRVRAIAPGARVMAVIKANAYGHALHIVARALTDADGLAVARIGPLSRGLRLRQLVHEPDYPRSDERRHLSMAGEAGQPPADLTAELLKKGHEFSFVQVLRLLRLLGHAAETPEDPAALVPANRTLRIRPGNSLAFPAADIAQIEKTDGEEPGFRVTATFLGLYGHASPLPTFYTEDLLEDETTDEPATREFLDIFNHRLFTLSFRCCMKYRLFFQVLEERNAGDLERLFCLLGLGEPGLRGEIPRSYSLSRYIGIMTQHPHSAWGLETLLRDAFRGVPVGVIQCFGRRVRIPPDQRLCLGHAGSRLGLDSVLGEERKESNGMMVSPTNRFASSP